MLVDLFPRAHARFLALPLLGVQIQDFALWLGARGFTRDSIRRRVQRAPTLETLLREGGVRSTATALDSPWPPTPRAKRERAGGDMLAVTMTL